MATIDKIRVAGVDYDIVDSSKATMAEVNAAITAATAALEESFEETLEGYVTDDELSAYTYDKNAIDGKLGDKVDTTAFTQYKGEVTSAITAATAALAESFDEKLDDYVTNDDMTAYTYSKSDIDKKVGDAFDSDKYYDKDAVDGKLADKVDTTAFTQYQGEVTSKLAEKVDVTAFTEYKGEVAAELADKLEASDVADYFDGASYNDSTKNIEFTHDGTVKATVSALPFIKDGMVENVEVKDGKLVITFNTDAGKEDIELEITDIFNADNYYTKDAADKQFGTLTEQNSLRSDLEDALGEIASLEADKADKGEAYTKEESDGKYATKTALSDAEKKIPSQYIQSIELRQGSNDELIWRDEQGRTNNVEFATINGSSVAYHNDFTLLEPSALNDYYTKHDAENKFAEKGESYTKAESDGKYAEKAKVEGTTLVLG